MSVSNENIINLLQGGLSNSAQSLSVTGDVSFRDNARIGDVIQARVLSNFDGGRYSVSINGKQQVVDSAIPLTTGELLHGRVVGVNGQKVIIQKIVDSSQTNNLQTPAATKLSAEEKIVQQIFTNYLANISGNDKAVLLQNIAASAIPQITALAGLVLKKIGLSIQPAYLKALEKLIQTRAPSEARGKPIESLLQQAPLADTQESGDVINQLATLIADLARVTKQPKSTLENLENTKTITAGGVSNTKSTDSQDISGDSEQQLGQWILNAQTHDNISHRLLTLPIFLDGKMIEVDMSFYSQKQSEQLKPAQRFKRLVFSLELEHLGTVNIEANITDRHVKLAFATETEATTETLAKYLSDLKATIDEDVWNIDDIQYITRKNNNDAVWSVVTHHISQDHISRLM